MEGYNSAVLESVRDAADQLSSLQSVQRQQAEQAQAQAAAESAYDIALQRYRAGLTGHLTVLTAETALLTQRRLGVDLRPATCPPASVWCAHWAAATRTTPPRHRAADATSQRLTEFRHDHPRHHNPRPPKQHRPPQGTHRRGRRRGAGRRRLRRLLGAGAQPLRNHRQRLRAGQRGAAHAAGRRHRGGHQRQRHRPRQGRPVAGSPGPGRRPGCAGPGRGAAGPDRARGAHAVRQQPHAGRADRACARPTWPAPRASRPGCRTT